MGVFARKIEEDCLKLKPTVIVLVYLNVKCVWERQSGERITSGFNLKRSNLILD